MNEPNFTILQVIFVVIIPSIITGIPAFLSALSQRKSRGKKIAETRETDASAAEKVATAYDKIVEDLQMRIDKMENRLIKTEETWEKKQKEWETRQLKLETKLDRQGHRIRVLERGISQLIHQVEELGAIPVFKLPEEDVKENND